MARYFHLLEFFSSLEVLTVCSDVGLSGGIKSVAFHLPQ